MCYSLWYNATTMLPASGRPATSWVHYTTNCNTSCVHYTVNCNTQSSAPEDVENNFLKHVELTGIINRPLFLHLVGCPYSLYQ